MNRRLFSVIKIFLFAVFTLFFSACSNNVDNTGSANFSISTEVFQSAIKKSLESDNSLRAAFFAEGDFGNKEYVGETINQHCMIC